MALRITRRKKRTDTKAALALVFGTETAIVADWAMRAVLEEALRKQRGLLSTFRATSKFAADDNTAHIASRRFALAQYHALNTVESMLTHIDSERIFESVLYRIDAVAARTAERSAYVAMAAMDPRMKCEPCVRVYYASTKTEEATCPYCKGTAVSPEPLK